MSPHITTKTMIPTTTYHMLTSQKIISIAYLLILIIGSTCSTAYNPEEVVRETGSFVLSYPSQNAFGYNILDAEHTSISIYTDIQIHKSFFSGAQLDSIYIATGLTSRGGGIILSDELHAPAYNYQLAYVVNRFDIAVLPLHYFLRCRGDSNYAKISLDSVHTIHDTCQAFFNYTLNVDPYEQRFIE